MIQAKAKDEDESMKLPYDFSLQPNIGVIIFGNN
jgi:hypothetical protein